MRPEPTLHKPIPMGTKVIVPSEFVGKEVTGIVSGIASMHVIFVYIVVLDEKIQDKDFGEMGAVAIPGPQLLDENGERAFLIDS